MDMTVLGTFLSSFVALAIPLILVAYGGMFSEHSGIINIALEGIMIIGAMAGSFVMVAFTSAVSSGMPAQLATFVAVLCAGVFGSMFALLLSIASNRFNADQVIAGTAMNLIAPALFLIIAWAIQGSGQTQVLLPDWYKIRPSNIGLDVSAMPELLRAFIFSKLSLMTTFFAIVLIPLAAFVLYRTKFGLRLRACGEHPQAAESLGINVYKMRYAGVAISGFLGGIGGLAYLMVISSSFDGQVSGYGFLALAVMIFGNWKPGKIILAGLFFSFFKTLSMMTSLLTWLPDFSIKASSQLYLMLPYVVTLIVLIFSSKRSQAPKAEGIPYDVSRRS